MAKLVLVRHGKSEWNALGLWTGWTDVSLNEEGREEARQAGEKIKDIHFDFAFTSTLKRAIETLDEIKEVLHEENLPTTKALELRERDYGDLTGKNKWKIKEEYGEDQFLKWRRGWDDIVPGGESLKNVYERVVPYYQKEILPILEQGKNVIIAAHGNSLRALVKYLENISDKDIPNLEIATGEVYIYDISNEGKIVNKEIRASHKNTGY
ncbi:MAG TPA: 2,3-diphosphoglycerate-dependent phosphoglycerate mutase [Patescibacteria group bacterium]